MLRQISTFCAALLLTTATLSGCGNKGDLYLPEDSANTFTENENTVSKP